MRPGRRVVVIAAVLCAATLGCGGPAGEQPSAARTTESMVAATPGPSADAAATTPTGQVLRYVALGDSLASGMGGEPSYASFYRRGLERRTGQRVELTNLGYPGWTSQQLLDALRSSDELRDAVAAADVVTWDIGGNDLVRAVIQVMDGTCGGRDGLRCMRETTDEFTTTWDAIVDELVTLRRDDDVALRTFDLYTPFIPPQARTARVLDQLDAMNATITATEGHEGVAVAEVADAFAGEFDALIDDDGLHPSQQGHRRIAELLLDLGVPQPHD